MKEVSTITPRQGTRMLWRLQGPSSAQAGGLKAGA